MAEQNERERYKIVIGVDFEQTGDDALAESLRIAREHPNDELHAVHVVKLAGDSAKQLDDAADRMGAAATKLRERVHAVCEALFPEEEWEQDFVFHVRIGEPAEAIHQVAIDYAAHLLVVGTHGRKGLSKLVLGSVADELVKTAHLPVLIATPRDFEGLEKSARADDKRPGEDLSDPHYHASERVSFGRRGGHIAGLI